MCFCHYWQLWFIIVYISNHIHKAKVKYILYNTWLYLQLWYKVSIVGEKLGWFPTFKKKRRSVIPLRWGLDYLATIQEFIPNWARGTLGNFWFGTDAPIWFTFAMQEEKSYFGWVTGVVFAVIQLFMPNDARGTDGNDWLTTIEPQADTDDATRNDVIIMSDFIKWMCCYLPTSLTIPRGLRGFISTTESWARRGKVSIKNHREYPDSVCSNILNIYGAEALWKHPTESGYSRWGVPLYVTTERGWAVWG